MLGMMILINGDRLIGEIYDGFMGDIEPSLSYTIDTPFKVDFRTIDGDYSFVLTPYVNFMNPDQTYLEIDKTKVISVVSINEDLMKYYKNTVIYNQNFIKPILDKGLRTVNTSLEAAVRPEVEQFARLLKKHNIDDFPSGAKH